MSVVSRKFLETIEPSVHKKTPVIPFSIFLSIESDVDFQVNEQAEICIKVNIEVILWRFFIVDRLSDNMVLGMDFLHDYDVTIECNPFNLKMSRNLAN